MRFSLRWMFGVTSFAAVACACLVFASESVITWMELALHMFLLLSVLGAFYAPRERRAFWGGCALMGWYYLASTYLPFELRPAWNMTDSMLAELYVKIAHEVPTESPVDDRVDETPLTPVAMVIPDDVLDFHHVGHMLATFFSAFVGGVVALWFDRRAVRNLSGSAPSSLT